MTRLVLYGYHAKPTFNLTFFGRNARKARPKCSSQEICPPRAFLRCKGNFHAAVLRDHGTRIGGCLGPPKLAHGKHDQNRLGVMKASRSLTTYVEKLRKKKDPKKELQAKSIVFWRFSQKNDNQWRKTGLPVTTETNWLVSLCPWQVRLTPPIDQPQLQPDGTQRRKRLRWPKDFGGKAMRLEAARNFETSLHYITLIVIIV